MQRDPIGYADGMSLYEYLGGNPLVAVDFGGLSSSGGGILAGFREAWGGIWQVGPYDAYDAGIGGSYQHAIEYSNKYKNKGSKYDPDGAQNAARHAMWQARLAYDHDLATAREVADLHEAGEGDSADHQADEHNNVVGRMIGARAKAEGRPISDLDDMVDKVMEDGSLIVDRKLDPRIIPSKHPGTQSPCSNSDSIPDSDDSTAPPKTTRPPGGVIKGRLF
jgi:hypothetical protein